MVVGAMLSERFSVERVAGRGGMSIVYRGKDGRTGEPVAVKVLTRTSDDATARFDREVQILEGLQHPAIVRQLAHGLTSDGEPFLVMEWLDGEDLGRRLRRERVSPEDALVLGRALASALGAAHELDVVHRDVKPSNVLLEGGDPRRPKLLDFGIARQLHGPTLTRTGLTIGTPRYMAPEQARGDRRVDGRADVFSLGCVLYECLTGRHAFEGNDMLAVLAKILLEDPAPMRAVTPEVPDWLDALIAAMLAKDPAARPQNMGEIVRAIDATGPRPAATARPHTRALTDAEQRVVSAILVPGAHHADTGETLDSDIVVRHDRLRASVGTLGATLETLADGGAVAIVESVGSARDQAATAARVALVLSAALGERGVGVATGRGVVRERLPVGDVLDRAAMLGRTAPRGRVHIDALTADLLDEAFEIKRNGELHELVGEAERVPSGRRLLGRPTPFVGRDRELATLESGWVACVESRSARVALVTGVAGSGKSRLRHELLLRLADAEQGPEVWLGRGDPTRASSPGYIVTDALRRTFAIARGEPAASTQARILARVRACVREEDIARVSTFLAEALGAPLSDEDIPTLNVRAQLATARRDAIVLGDQVRRAFEDFALASAAARPLAFVLEDLHWADPVAIRMVDGLLRLASDVPLFVLVLARPEIHDAFPNLWRERPLELLPLGPLSRRAAERLARAVMGPDAEASAVDRVVEVAAGNAFYLEECLRAQAEGVTKLPETVLAMVHDRLDSQSVEARRVLRAASVFGGTFWTGGVRALVGEGDVEGVLGDLEARELVTRRAESRFSNEVERTFRHAVVRDAAYASLTEDDRRLGHGLAGAWLAARGETDAAAVATHLRRGGDDGAAASWFVRAATQALAANDLEGTLTLVREALECGALGEARGGALLLAAEARRWRGEFADGLEESVQAMALLPPTGVGFFHAAAEAAVQANRQNKVDQVVEVGRTLLSVENTASPDAEVAYLVALSRVAWQVLLATGRDTLAEEVLGRFEARAPRVVDPTIRPRVALVTAYRARQRGDILGALRLDTEAAGLFEEIGDLRMGCNQRMNVGFGHMSLGNLEDANRELGGALAMAERMGLHQITTTVRHNLGLVRAYLGRHGEAIELETRAIDAFVAMGDVWFESFALVYRSLIHTLAGNPTEAEADARRALECAEVTAQRVYAHAALALSLLALGRDDEALVSAGEAWANREGIGMDEVEAVVRLAWAEALRARDAGEARAAADGARTWLTGVADQIGEPSARASFLELPFHARILRLASM